MEASARPSPAPGTAPARGSAAWAPLAIAALCALVPLAPLAGASIDDLAAALGDPARRTAAAAELRQLGPAAVPRLLALAQSRDIAAQSRGIAGLIVAWADEAKPVVVAALDSPVPAVRGNALQALHANLPEPRLTARLRDLARHRHLDIRVAALDGLEQRDPDPARMLDLLAEPRARTRALRWLPRHHDQRLTAATIAALAQPDGDDTALALAALTVQAATDAPARRAVAGLLTHAHAGVRARAAEWLRWHGEAVDLPVLERLLAGEADLHARAVQVAARDAIAQRVRGERGVAAAAAPAGDAAALRYHELAARLAQGAPHRQIMREQAEVERFARAWRFTGAGDAPWLPAARARARLLRALVGPWAVPGAAPPPPPPADVLVPPVRGYRDPRRASFGAATGSGGPFADSVHLGDDVAWFQDLAPVVAMAAGTVRMADHAVTNWGGLVVIEHQRSDGTRFCSLYAHLDGPLAVASGDNVAAGQLIGPIGRSHTAGNGGYFSHLHVGLHRGAYDGGGWITGYLAPDRFHAGGHGWVDPQQALADPAILAR